MNAVEIEEAVSNLAEAPFDPEVFPFAFLEAFGNKPTTIKRLKSSGKSSTNKSDLAGGVLQRNNIHIQVCAEGEVANALSALRESPATIADMYDPVRMDSEFPLVREAHERNDEVLERIYIGRRFKNDTERLEKLFELYTEMTGEWCVVRGAWGHGIITLVDGKLCSSILCFRRIANGCRYTNTR
ncbi:MAG: type IIL restriction-modification enzyme MmeI [Chloroflexota bacterium]